MKNNAIFVFGYGSLMNKKSLATTLGRNINSSDMICAALSGYRRVWNSHAQIKDPSTGAAMDALFLNLEDSRSSQVNGILIEVNDVELNKLKIREKNYELIELDVKLINPPRAGAAVLTFIDYDTPRFGRGCAVIAQKYIEKVDASVSEFGTDFANSFWSSTEPPSAPFFEGDYRFVDPGQNAFAFMDK